MGLACSGQASVDSGHSSISGEKERMRPARRRFLRFAAGAAALPMTRSLSWAQAYPTRPVRIVVGYAAGGAQEILARLIGQALSERFSQPFVIENRPGAGGNIATESVAKASPDTATRCF